MNKNSLANLVMANFEGASLPPDIEIRFDILELLASNGLSETYLLSDTATGERYVLKGFQRARQMTSESKLLAGVNHKGLPKFEPEIWHNNSVYTLREYVDGMPLDKYLAEYGILTDEDATRTILELCEIVGLLHSQPTPIIHRDIKPSNIIISRGDSSVNLIDFGISRKYNPSSKNDTAVYLTPEYAPPEQYGYAQTDVRTDIYSIGVVLRKMLTGTTSHVTVINNRALHKIVRKCTALDPNSRYQSINALVKALKNTKKPKTRLIPRIAAIFLCFAALSWGGFLYARHSIQAAEAETYEYESYYPYENIPAYSYPLTYPYPVATMSINPGIYIFSEPLVEASVRRILGIEASEPITYSQLEMITAIRIYGMYPSHLTTDLMRNPNEYVVQEGNILTLEDFRAMPNLQILELVKQPIFDLLPLVDNQNLAILSLERTYVADLTPVLSLPNLRELHLNECIVTDWSIIESMRSLETLRIVRASTNIYSIADLGDITLLNVLDLSRNDTLVCLKGLDNRTRITHLDIRNTGVCDFSFLNDPNVAPRLIHLLISPYMERYLYTLDRDSIIVIVCDYF